MSESDERPVALVTGASRGIGVATATQLAETGYDVVLAARESPALETAAEQVRTRGARALAVPTDVGEPAAIEALVATIDERFGRLDAAIVNAGTGEPRDVPLEELALEDYRQVVHTNVDGAFLTTRAVLPALRAAEGALVYVGSYMAVYPNTSTPIYAASKWWLRGFAHSVAGRVGPDGVTVSLINPSGVPTNFGADLREQANDERLDAAEELSADQVAESIGFAVETAAPGAVAELNLFRQDIYERF